MENFNTKTTGRYQKFEKLWNVLSSIKLRDPCRFGTPCDLEAALHVVKRAAAAALAWT